MKAPSRAEYNKWMKHDPHNACYYDILEYRSKKTILKFHRVVYKRITDKDLGITGDTEFSVSTLEPRRQTIKILLKSIYNLFLYTSHVCQLSDK